MKKVFELLNDAKEEHDKIQAALDETDEIPHSMLVGWIGAELDLLTEVIKRVEELEARLDLMKKKF